MAYILFQKSLSLKEVIRNAEKHNQSKTASGISEWKILLLKEVLFN